MKHFVEIHLGDAAGGIMRIVIMHCVDDQALEHSGHFFGNFFE
jgi:hypothetical protein